MATMKVAGISTVGISGAERTLSVVDVELTSEDIWRLAGLVLTGGKISAQNTEGDILHLKVEEPEWARELSV